MTAGLLALTAVAAFVIFVGAVLDWFGWLPNLHDDQTFVTGFHFWLLVLELLTVVATAVVLRHVPVPASGLRPRRRVLVLRVRSALQRRRLGGDLDDRGGSLVPARRDRGRRRPFAAVRLLAPRGRGPGPRRRPALVLPRRQLRLDRDRADRARSTSRSAIGSAVRAGSSSEHGGCSRPLSSSPTSGRTSPPPGSSSSRSSPSSLLSGLVDEGYSERHPHQWAGPVTFAVTGLVFIGLALFLARRSRPPLAEI